MTHPSYMLLFVDKPQASGRFYADLLQAEPVESSPTFVLFALSNGLMLGLWSRHTAEPAVTVGGGGSEVAFRSATHAEVDRLHGEWVEKGVAILQPPTDMDFGRTFVGLDPDGHRLRVLCADA